MDAIPGIISLFPNEASIDISTELRVTMTNQTALMVHGSAAHGFVITRKGTEQYRHLAKMVEKNRCNVVLAPRRVTNSPDWGSHSHLPPRV